MPFMILKDAYSYQNIERPEFPRYMWMNVVTLSVDNGELSKTVGTDFRPCTVEDFDGDQD